MDRVTSFHELLPQYLKGENVTGHCNVVEKMTYELYSQIRILHDWNELDRPILVEHTHISNAYTTYTVHIHTHSPIRKIQIWGGYNFSEEYSVDEMLTNTTITFTAQHAIIDSNSFRVHVETYNDMIYDKSYPENDTIMGTPADHDLYLDIVGRFLGVPRKQYVEYPVSEGANANPPYFGKYKYQKNWDLYYGPCTEDDYVYACRLKQFVEDRQTSVLNAFIQARYDKRVIVVSGDDVLLADLQENFPDFVQEHSITQEWLDNNRYGLYTVYVSSKSVPANYQHAFSNEDIYLDIKRLLPCTRLALVTDMRPINFSYEILELNPRMGRYAQRNDAKIKFVLEGWVNLDFIYTVDGVEYYGRTDANGEYVFTVQNYGQKRTYQMTITTAGNHGEEPLDESFEITVIGYAVDHNRYASHDESDYTYSSTLRPTSEEISEGYSTIVEDGYYEEED